MSSEGTIPEQIARAEAENGSDWEYEYHETETESFYVTLDLSSTIGPIRPKKKPKPQPTNEATTATPVASAQSQSALATPDPSEDVPNPELNGGNPDPSGEGGDEAAEENRIQILDLHTSNPIISYRNHIFDCHWASTIGTDLLITAPNPSSDLPKLKEGPGYDILGATSIKIVGRSAQLAPKPDVRVSRNTDSAEAANQEGDETGVKIPLGPASSKARQNQAKFLERLINVKKAKGEQDSVTVHSQKRMTNSGWRVQQNRRRAEDGATMEGLKVLVAEGDEVARERLREMEARVNEDESGEEAELGTTVTESGRGVGSSGGRRGLRRGPGRPKKRAPGGLFRDYRPVEGDEEFADIRGTPATTPLTWGAVAPSDTVTATAGVSEPVDRPDEAMPDATS